LVIGCSFAALFAIMWLALGTAARARQDREMAARMASAGRPSGVPAVLPPGSGGWIPPTMTEFGRRFASAGGFGDSLDMRLEAAGVNVRSGEFVVGSVVAGLVGAAIGAVILGNPILALVVGAACGLGPYFTLQMSLGRRAEKL